MSMRKKHICIDTLLECVGLPFADLTGARARSVVAPRRKLAAEGGMSEVEEHILEFAVLVVSNCLEKKRLKQNEKKLHAAHVTFT